MWAESSRALHGQSILPTPQGGLYLPFREDHRDQHIQNSESGYSSFLGGTDSFAPSTNSFQQSHLVGHEPFRDSVGNLFVREYTAGEYKGESRYTSVEKQQQSDGAEILAILSTPNVTADLLDAFHEEEAIDWHLTQEHRSALLAKMKEHDGLDRLPNIVSETCSFPPFAGNIEEESYLYFGYRMEREEAQRTWKDQWGEVLTHYADEVWGDLLPLVEEARKEVEVLKEDPKATIVEQPKALRRLGLILSHLRES
jgi:hypothetical protein